MPKFQTAKGVELDLPASPSNLTIYRACAAAGLLRNQTHSALDYCADDSEITVYRSRDGEAILSLNRVTE